MQEKETTSFFARLREFFALEHNIVVMLGAIVVLGMGEELWVRFIPKYLEVLGASALAIGAYGSYKKVVDAVYQYPGGWLSDHLGRKRALVLFNVVAASGYLLYLITDSWQLVIFGSLLVLAWSSMSQPAIFALIGDSLGRSKRAMGFSVQSIWKRVPIVIAPPIGGYLLDKLGLVKGMHVGFAISLVFALVAIFFQNNYYREKEVVAKKNDVSVKEVWGMIHAPLRRLLLADCLVRFGANVFAVYVVLQVINVYQKSPTVFGSLISVQMIVAILGYLPAAYLADKFGRQPFILITFALFAIFPLALVTLPTAWIVVAFVLAGLREFGEPARKARIVDLAHEEHRGSVVGLYYLIRGFVTIPAPMLGGYLWGQGTSLPFYLGAAISTLGLVLYAVSPKLNAEIK